MARILLIEDNPDNLELMSYLLGAYGHTVATADDGESGIAVARETKPDLVACDIHLPGVDGYGVARALKAEASLDGTPVVAVTALAMVGDREKILAAGFDGYITKPIDPHQVVAELDAFLPQSLRGAAPQHEFGRAAAVADTERAKLAAILVVDDAPTNRELILETLTPYGYDVRLAESVAEAMEILRDFTPDLILSDLHMPGEDGFKFIRRIKDVPRLAALPFMFISSSVWGENDRETALALGITRFLLRPIEPRRLIDEIARCLPERRGANDGGDPGR
ncbi:MAG TPA: response regulator [Rhodanobacteraceae bacterium]|nr:response regulator [Rhodanobacteraceae bacterium]